MVGWEAERVRALMEMVGIMGCVVFSGPSELKKTVVTRNVRPTQDTERPSD